MFGFSWFLADDLALEALGGEFLLTQPDRLAHVAGRIDRRHAHERLEEGNRLVLVDRRQYPLGEHRIDPNIAV